MSLVLACVLGIISCRMSPIANAATLMTQRKSPIVPSSDFYPAGGKPAMKSFLDTSAFLASRLTESKKTKLFAANKRPSAQDVQALKVSFILFSLCPLAQLQLVLLYVYVYGVYFKHDMWIICSMMSMPMCLMYIKKSRECVYIYILFYFFQFSIIQ